MTRYTFGGYGGDQVTQSPSANAGVFKAAGSLASTGTFWSAQSGGTQYTDLVDPNNAGAAITGVSTDANGRPLAFQGPNGVTEGWLDFGGGRFKVMATENTTTLFGSKFETGTAKTIYVNPATGSDSLYQGTMASAPKATIAGAMAVLGSGTGRIVLSDGVHEVGNGLSLSGAKCSIVGQGVVGMTSGGTAEGTVIKASTQTGPVLDFTGYSWPDSFRGRVEFGGFAIQGSNAADATKNNAGMRIATPTAASGSGHFHDIAISQTGGPCLDLGAVYLSDFQRITMITPVSANANDVPYMKVSGANGNRFIGLGFRSMLSSADVGPSGAVVIDTGGGTYAPHDNLFLGTWFEFLHVPTNGCYISCAGNANIFDGTEFFDGSKDSAATGTAFVRFKVPSSGSNLGGNMWRGYVPGKGTSGVSIDLGIDVQQSNNSITGTKGYQGTNVQLAAGVNNTTVILSGGESTASVAAFVDNSGTSTNVLIDNYNRSERHGSFSIDERTSGQGGAGPRYQDAVTPANGAFWLGTSGVRVLAQSAVAYCNADTFTMRDVAQTVGHTITFDLSLRPGITLGDHGALPAASAGLQGKIAHVRGASGVKDHLYICEKDATNAYVWTQIT